MSDAVWKWPLDIVGEQKISTPEVWKPLYVDHQDGVLTLWGEVGGDGGEWEIRTIVVVGTGHNFNAEGMTYIGSSIDPTHPLVWHVYSDPEGVDADESQYTPPSWVLST